MGRPVVFVQSGGRPVTLSTNGYGEPVTEATNGFGEAVTLVESGGYPIVGGGGAPSDDWLLSGGVWNDDGIWDDASVWEDD